MEISMHDKFVLEHAMSHEKHQFLHPGVLKHVLPRSKRVAVHTKPEEMRTEFHVTNLGKLLSSIITPF